jgi:hypothetical protein
MSLDNALRGTYFDHWYWAAECSGLSCLVLATGISRISNTYEMKGGAFIVDALTFGHLFGARPRALLASLERGVREFVRHARGKGGPVGVGGAGAAAPESVSARQAAMMC